MITFLKLRPYLILVFLWAIEFAPLIVQPGGTLTADYSDFTAEHLPAKLFLNREWNRSGELPLWNPLQFCGSPFLHDIQVGIFYPPYAIVYCVPESAVGAALSWVLAVHVLAAGVFTYWYARSHRLGEVGSLVAAVGFMLSPKWMTHLLLAGHTVTMGLAWLPLLLLALEKAISRESVAAVVGAGVALALLVLGTHPQWTFYAICFAAVWSLAMVELTPRALGRWLIIGVAVGVVAMLLAAVQLLPTWEAAGQSSRTHGMGATGSLSLALPTLLGLVGPSATNDPPRSWEVRGVFGICWLAAAIIAPRIVNHRATRWRFATLVGLVFFSVGGAALLEWLPGFGWFRVPGRMLLIATFPIAMLAGTTTDALVRARFEVTCITALDRVVRQLGLTILPLGLFLAVHDWWNQPHHTVWLPAVMGWLGIVLATLIAGGLLPSRIATKPQRALVVWVLALMLEVFGPTVGFVEVQSQSLIYPAGEITHHLKSGIEGDGRVMCSVPGEVSVLGTGEPISLVNRIESVGGYNPLDVRHYREFLSFVEANPEPVRGNSRLGQQVLPVIEVQNEQLFDQLHVMYLIVESGSPLPPGSWNPSVVESAPKSPPPRLPGAPLTLPSQTLYTSRSAPPRARVVLSAALMPPGEELNALHSRDLATTVLLSHDGPLPVFKADNPGAVRIVEYRPNRVEVDVAGRTGILLLADVWYPGWACHIDGVKVPVYRANHAFRAVVVPPGSNRAVYTFEPWSYRVGWWVSLISTGIVALCMLSWLVRHLLSLTRQGAVLE